MYYTIGIAIKSNTCKLCLPSYSTHCHGHECIMYMFLLKLREKKICSSNIYTLCIYEYRMYLNTTLYMFVYVLVMCITVYIFYKKKI